MLVTRVILKNWRNFCEADVPMRDQTYLIGPNASGKSNFLDVFRFLRDISKPQGGGFQSAVALRGGLSKLRCLHARRDTTVSIEVHLGDNADDVPPQWRYVLAFNFESRGARAHPLILREEVWKHGEMKLSRPDDGDRRDEQRRTQTHLEQIQANGEFREIAEFFCGINYLHLVPQLLKFGESIGGQLLEGDPFGQAFLVRIAKTPEKERSSRLNKILKALVSAIPQFPFNKLEFAQDVAGHPHIKATYKHHRPSGAFQYEDQFSDGTLRLIGILWSMLEDDAVLLLEEPELSLNGEIVRQFPLMLHHVQRAKKTSRQAIISTHSEALLENEGIDARGILILEPEQEGTRIRSVNEAEKRNIQSGLSIAEAILPKVKSCAVQQLSLWS